MAIVYSVHYMSWSYGNFFCDLMAKHDGFDKSEFSRFYNKSKGVWETAGPVCFNPRSDKVNTGKAEFQKFYNLNQPINKTKMICKAWTHNIEDWDPVFMEGPNDVRPVFLQIDSQNSHSYRRMVWGCGDAGTYFEEMTNKAMVEMIDKISQGYIQVNIDQILKLNEKEYEMTCDKLETKPWKFWKHYVTEYMSLKGNPNV